MIVDKSLDFLIGELNQIQSIADRHAENNHVPWDYCMWLHDRCDSRPDFADFTFSAWELSGQYMCSHVSDASHMAYRQKLVSRILSDRDRLKGKFLMLAKKTATKEGIKGLKDDDAYLIGMLVYEFHLNTSLMGFWANHEGIWCYRRFLVWCWMTELPTLVSRHGDLRLQHAGGCVSDHFCAFDMYFNKCLQKKFLRTIKADESHITRYKDWIEMFCPGAGCWDDEWLL